MKQFLWLGSFMNEDIIQIMISQGYRNAASYVSQKNILEGIEHETGIVFDSVNAVSMAGYPRQGGLTVHSYTYSHSTGARDTFIGYLNPLYLNKFFMKRQMIKGVKLWIEERYKDGNALDLFIYEMRSACLDAAAYIKKKIPQARIHLIIPDLPCFMDLHMSKFKKTLKQIDWNHMVSKLDCITDFFPYTETMVDYLDIRDKKWMVMEGSIRKVDIEKITKEIDNVVAIKNEKKIVMYSGCVDQAYGLDSLVESMDYLDDSYQLWITGGGSYEHGLKEKIKNNSRVIYYGFIQNREELFKLQAQVSVMMNMRDPDFEAANYCFPSKLFEYMLLGVPVLSVKLRGIPDEYWKYLYDMNSLEPKEIAAAIQTVMVDKKRDEKASAGRRFVENKKNNFAMAKKIIKFIEG